jgi:two-component system, NtrC family, sensor kinase
METSTAHPSRERDSDKFAGEDGYAKKHGHVLRRHAGDLHHFVSRHAIILAAAVAVLLMLACVSFRVVAERQEAIRNGVSSSETLVQLLEEQTTRALQAVDMTLVGVIDALRVVDTGRNYDPEIEELLRERLASLPYVRALFVVSPSGLVRQHSGSPKARGISVMDREYFQAHLRNPALDMFFGGAFSGRVSGKPSIGMSRRIEGSDGWFGGLAVAAVDPRYFDQFYKSLRLSPSDGVALFHTDGTLLSMSPSWRTALETLGPEANVFNIATAAAQHASASADSIGGRRYWISARRLAVAPVIVSVALSEDALLAPWRHSATMAYVESLSLGAAVIGLALVLSWHRRRFELARERQMLAHNLESLGRMTGGVAHDFRNTLGIIRTSLDAVRISRDRAKMERWIAIGTDAAKEGEQLISRLLAFSKSQKLTLCAMNVHDEVKAIMPLLQEAAGPLISIARKIDAGTAPCLTDRTQFASALINLVINARDAMENRGRIQIIVANLTEDERTRFHIAAGTYVKITIEDDGRGMSESVIRRAVEPFFTTKGPNGTGLGLSQVYGFVRQIGGDMRIESELGIGTAVHLILPQTSAEEPVDREPVPDAREATPVEEARRKLRTVTS